LKLKIFNLKFIMLLIAAKDRARLFAIDKGFASSRMVKNKTVMFCCDTEVVIIVKGYFVTVIASVSQRSNPLKTKRLLRLRFTESRRAGQKSPRNDCNFNPDRVYERTAIFLKPPVDVSVTPGVSV
jgi:hypothetical protein